MNRPNQSRASARGRRFAIIVGVLALLVVGAAIGAVTLARHHVAVSQAAVTHSSAAPRSGEVQTDDLSSDLASANASVTQSQSDQQQADTSINDSSSQTAVPTE